MLNPKKTKKQRQHLRKSMTEWEVRHWNDLKQKKMLGYKIRRQYGVNNYIIDFYCPKLRLGIEVDGYVHFFNDIETKDKQKDKVLKDLGIKIVRIKTLDLEDDYESMIVYLEDFFKYRAKHLK